MLTLSHPFINCPSDYHNDLELAGLLCGGKVEAGCAGTAAVPRGGEAVVGPCG